VSDSPLWLCEFYGRRDLYPPAAWAEVIRAHYRGFEVLPILVNRVGRFETSGRVHDEAASVAAHEAIAAIARREYGDALVEIDADVRTPFRVIERLADGEHIPPEMVLNPFCRWYAREVETYE
jgi:hypothetical protein